MKTDLQIKTDVNAELMWDPAVVAANVGVAVKNGIDSLAEHAAALGTAGATQGVVRVVDRLEVRPRAAS